MQKADNRFPTLFFLSLLSLLIGSCMLLFEPFADFNGDSRHQLIGYIGVTLFWLFTVGGYVIFGLAVRQRSALSQDILDKFKKPARPGAVHFFRGPEGKAVDIAFAASLIACIVLVIVPLDSAWPFTACAVVFILTLQLHCMLNGYNYQIAKYILQSRRVKNDH